MKTSKILMAMALPVAFAACTSEDVLESTQTDALNARKVLGDIEIVMGESVDSRFANENGTWTFNDGDAFGAALVDVPNGKSFTNPFQNYELVEYIQTNYKYAKGEGNTWTTPARMVEGNYMFYAPFNEKHLSRKPLEMITPIAQTLNVDEEGNVEPFSAINNLLAAEDANPMFIGYQFLPATDQPTKLAIDLHNIFSYPEVTIENDKDEDITIYRYVIKTNDKFYVKAPFKNANVVSHLYNWGENTKKNPWGDWAVAQSKYNGLKGFTSDLLDTANGVKTNTILVEIPDGLTIAAGGSQTFYIVMPAEAYLSGYTAYVYTSDDEGYMFANGGADMTMYSGQRYPQEEFTNKGEESSRAGEMFGLEIKKNTQLKELSTEFPVIVSTTEELIAAIGNGTSAFTVIPTSDEVTIDADVVKAMRQVKFQGMTIDGSINIEGGATAATALTLDENVKILGTAIVKGNVVLKDGVESVEIATAKVEEDAELTITDATVGTIENYGITNINQKEQNVDVVNYGTLNINAKDYEGEYTAGTETDDEGVAYVVPTAVVNVNATYSSAATSFEGVWNVNANMTTEKDASIYGNITLAAGKTLDGEELTVEGNAVLNVNGSLYNEIVLNGILDADLTTPAVLDTEYATLNLNETSFFKANFAAADETGAVENIVNVKTGAAFFKMDAPAENVTSWYLHVGNVTSEDNFPAVALPCNSLNIDGSVIATKENLKLADLDENQIKLMVITGDVMGNGKDISADIETVKINGNVILTNSALNIDKTALVKNLTIGGELSIASNAEFNHDLKGDVTIGGIDSEIELNFAETTELVLKGDVATKVKFTGSKNNTVINNAEILLGTGVEFWNNEGVLHIEGNVDLDGGTFLVENVNIYNSGVLTIEKKTVVGNLNLTGAEPTFAPVNLSKFGGVAGAKATGVVVNKGTVKNAAKAYQEEDGDSTVEAGEGWWSGNKASV